MALHLYDTLRREKVLFEPREPGRVSMYLCGPTVQADAHIGHGRAAVVFDVLRRWLAHQGSEVLFVRNVTDVDDKIIMRARREKTTFAQVAEKYDRAYNRTLDELGVLPADIQPHATGHLLEMQAMIAELIEQGKAYEAEGNVLFRVRSFPEYGRLSNRRIDDMQQGEDVVGSEIKQDPLDFAMWKAAKPGEPCWPSPWGPGRPGWHIECSAMAAAHLGGQFDIHGGGLDLVFPHHENEIAQYEAARGEPFARHWVHNGMVQLGDDKMSKSEGNVIGLEEATLRWGAGPLRLWYLSGHHRSPLVFEEDRVQEASTSWERFLTFLVTAVATLRANGEAFGLEVQRARLVDVEAVLAPDSAAVESYLLEFAEALDDDLNAPRAVAALHRLVNDGFERLQKVDAGDLDAARAVVAMSGTLIDLADTVLGLGLQDALDRAARYSDRIAGVVDDLLARRADARSAKDFVLADAFRDDIAALGVVVEDRPNGPRWYIDPMVTVNS